MRHLFLRIASLLVFAGLLVGCDAFSSDDESDAFLRLYNGSPDAGRIDLLVENDIEAFSIPFKRASGYVRVPAGENQTITVRREGDGGQVLSDLTQTLEEDQHYSIYALGPQGSLNSVFLNERRPDNDDAGLDGSSRLRVLHGSTTSGAVDVYVVRTPVGEEDFVVDLTAESPTYPGVNLGDVTAESTFDVSVDPESSIGNSFSIVVVPSGSTDLEASLFQGGQGMAVGGAYLALLFDEPDSTLALGTNAQVLSNVIVVE